MFHETIQKINLAHFLWTMVCYYSHYYYSQLQLQL